MVIALIKVIGGIIGFFIAIKFILIAVTIIFSLLAALINLGVIVITVLVFVVVGAIAVL